MNLEVTNKAIFLDRDGVINVDKQYVSKIEDFEFKDGIFNLLHSLQEMGYILIIVTNQSGIGRGYYSLEDFEKLTQWKLDQLAQKGIKIHKVYYCPHAPELKCDCRKPSPKMLLEAQKSFNIDMKRSWMIGDKKSDIEAGKNAGVGKTVLIGCQEVEDTHGADFFIQNVEELKELVRRYEEELS
jgi:D-glycero-D-manno-heptose 1,7-bisphosphate phosphatase